MNIGVQSYPELYTTLIGWQLYDQIWQLLKSTGLAFVPFIGIVLRNIAQPYESQETKDASKTSVRRMEIQIFATIFFIFLGVSPFIPLDPTMVSYTPGCQPNGQNNTFTPGNTQTTWDSAFTVPTQAVTVPVWWIVMMSLGEGFASASNTLVACAPDLRSMVSQVDMAQITDPSVKQQLQQFELNCYIPARTQYLQDVQNNGSTVSTISNDRQQYGQDDTEWFGSHGFQDTYYQNLKASQPIPGFAYNASQDINADTNKQNPPAYGTPTCNDWWNDSTNGLKTKLNNALPKTFWDQFNSFIQSKNQQSDDVVKRVLNNNQTGYQSANTTVGDSSYSQRVENIGSWLTGLTAYPKLYAAAQAAPIIQSVLLMMVYAFLPFGLVFSGYKPASFVAGAVIIFSLIYWSFIWHLVTYVDSTLMNALYGNNWFDEHSPSAVLADIIIGTLIIVAPLFWFSLMGAMGVAAGNLASGALMALNQPADQAAVEGSGTVKSIARTGIGLLK